MNLDFGCGESVRRGFIGVDIRPNNGVKFVCNAADINNYVDKGSVDIVYSRHFFEHLSFDQGRHLLHVWHSILKDGGTVEIIVPDINFHIQQWTNKNRATTVNDNGVTDLDWAIAGIWGKQRGFDTQGETWDFHKSGYDYTLLRDFLVAANFSYIERVPHLPKNLCVKALK